MNNEQVFVWPSKECFKAWCKWLVIVLSSFLIVYLTSNEYAANQDQYFHLYAGWELSIPLVPPFILIYMTYVLVFAVILFVLKTPHAIKALAYTLLLTIAVSGVIFVMFPGQLGFVRQEYIPGYDALFKFLFTIDQPHNLYPSLHIAFAISCVLAMIDQTNHRLFHTGLKIWFTLVCLSVLLVHQHHFFDIFSGIGLGALAHQLVFLKVMEKSSSEEQALSSTNS